MMFKGVLLDIDGTVMTGTDPLPGAAEAIRYLQEQNIPYRFISNGTRRSRMNVLEKLKRLGVSVTLEDIFTPAVAAVEYLREKQISACNLLVTSDLMTDFLEAGISHDPESANVVVGDAADRFTYETMNTAFRGLIRGGELIALEKDRYWKDIDGLSLGAGAFVAALEYAAGCKVILMGKPSNHYFAAARSGFPGDTVETIMVGDDIVTDVKGAMDAGLTGVIVFSGKFSIEEIDTCGIEPDASMSSIALLPQFLQMHT